MNEVENDGDEPTEAEVRAGRERIAFRTRVGQVIAGFAALALGVHRDNPARRLYEKCGSVHTHDEGDYRYYTLHSE